MGAGTRTIRELHQKGLAIGALQATQSDAEGAHLGRAEAHHVGRAEPGVHPGGNLEVTVGDAVPERLKAHPLRAVVQGVAHGVADARGLVLAKRDEDRLPNVVGLVPDVRQGRFNQARIGLTRGHGEADQERPALRCAQEAPRHVHRHQRLGCRAQQHRIGQNGDGPRGQRRRDGDGLVLPRHQLEQREGHPAGGLRIKLMEEPREAPEGGLLRERGGGIPHPITMGQVGSEVRVEEFGRALHQPARLAFGDHRVHHVRVECAADRPRPLLVVHHLEAGGKEPGDIRLRHVPIDRTLPHFLSETRAHLPTEVDQLWPRAAFAERHLIANLEEDRKLILPEAGQLVGVGARGLRIELGDQTRQLPHDGALAHLLGGVVRERFHDLEEDVGEVRAPGGPREIVVRRGPRPPRGEEQVAQGRQLIIGCAGLDRDRPQPLGEQLFRDIAAAFRGLQDLRVPEEETVRRELQQHHRAFLEGIPEPGQVCAAKTIADGPGLRGLGPRVHSPGAVSLDQRRERLAYALGRRSLRAGSSLLPHVRNRMRHPGQAIAHRNTPHGMSHTPLGEICVSLGLLTPAEVARVLERMSEDEGRGMRFGEAAISLKLLDDSGVSRALAQQFRLNLVPDDRVDKLQITPDVLALIPAGLMRDRCIVPTFLEPEKRVLSLLTHDPTDIAALRQVQAATSAARLRLFVASRSALLRLLERLVPHAPADPFTRFASRPETREVDLDEPITLLVEPDAGMAAALRRLESLEGGEAEVVSDPEAVAALLGPDRVVRLFFRRANARLIDSHVGGWRRACPGLLLCPVDGFGLSGRSAVPEDRARRFFLQLTEFLLLAGESKQMDARGRVRRTVRLTAAIAEELQLRPEDCDALQLAALFCDLDELSLVGGMLDTRDEGRRFALAMTVLRQFEPPWDVDHLFAAVERRLSGQEGPGRDLRVEILYTARAAVRAAVVAGGDPVEALGPEAARHDARVLRALAHVHRRQGLRHQVAAGGGSSATIVVAEREGAVLTALEARLSAAGFDVLVAADGEQALQLARNLIPAAVVANQRLPRKDGITLMLEMRRIETLRNIPVILLTDKGGGAKDVARGLELGAEDVLEKPIHPDVVVAKLRRAVARRPTESAGISGVLHDLGLIDLLQTLTLGGKTALVQILEAGEPGAVQVREGQIVAAQHGRRTGEEALYSLALLNDGRFDVRFEDSGTNNIHGQSEFLLLEALRRRDEQRESGQ